MHFLVVCSRLQFVSQNYIRRLKGILYLENSEIIADSYIGDPEKLTQIILDCSVYGARGVLSFFRMYIPLVYRRTTFLRRNVSVNKSNYLNYCRK